IDDTDFNLTIYDRWGGIMFQTSTFTSPWDGSNGLPGNIAPPGTYVWRVITRDSYTGNRVEYKGHVTLLR
ncbi:MAG: gliding motility-associated C-terminal domain-containing protein, partial [Flavobacteriales bacterium]|nr:gliding motility-associated C-terminal domain-containing protein [Flavobacteriales bacterium]